MVLFDRQREILLSMAENIARASREQVQELLPKLVERIETANRVVTRIVWTPAARPFFAADFANSGGVKEGADGTTDCVVLAPPERRRDLTALLVAYA